MKNINEMKDEEITILRYCPCEKKYVKKENDDEVLYSKEEWENKQEQSENSKVAKNANIQERLEILQNIKVRQQKKKAQKKLPPFSANKKLFSLRKRFEEIKLSKQEKGFKY